MTSESRTGPKPRSVYGRGELIRLLEPRSVAIVGASPRPGSFGQRAIENMAAFSGPVYLVNPGYDRIGERDCFPSLSSLPEVPDCVVIAVAREAVEDVVREAVVVGCGGLVLFASGYTETGKPDRIAAQEKLATMVSGTSTRLVGPNCIGLFNFGIDARLTFGPQPRQGRPGPNAIGLVSQSGALGQALSQASSWGVSFSHVLTAGNSCDVEVADFVAYLAEDPACRAISCIFEGGSAPLRLVEAARIAWLADKPLIVHKIATGQRGAAAAISHTGSLSGSTAAYSGALRQAGAVLAERFEDVVEMSSYFAKAPAPRGRGVAVVSTSGGGAIMAADAAERHGIDLPQPSPDAKAVLDRYVPDFGSTANPCDVTAQVLNDPEALTHCANALLAQPEVGTIVYPHPFAYDQATPRIGMLGGLSARVGKFACTVWINEWREGPGAHEAQSRSDVAVFRSMDTCFHTIAAAHARQDLRVRSDTPSPSTRLGPDAANLARRALRSTVDRVLTEREAKVVLRAYGVPVIEECLVQDAQEAVEAGARLGFPVALKIESPDIPHKTEAGVIRLNVADPEAVRGAYDGIRLKAAAVRGARINGVLVQAMAPTGLEMVIGTRTDPLFGPLVVVGLGGVLVELLRDTSTALAPVTSDEARHMLLGLAGARLLEGFRGSAPVDLEQLAGIVSRVSQLAADLSDEIDEIDINPLVCSPGRMVAVDALLVKARRGLQQGEAPGQ